jgi:hypothetical protein
VLAGEREPVEVRFMEGPFLAEIGPRIESSVQLQLVEDGLRRQIRYSAEVPMDILLASVVAASEAVLTEARSKHWWSADADDLASALKALRP